MGTPVAEGLLAEAGDHTCLGDSCHPMAGPQDKGGLKEMCGPRGPMSPLLLCWPVHPGGLAFLGTVNKG